MSFSILHHGGLNQALVAQTFMIAIAPVSVHIVPQSFRPTSRNLRRAPVYLITSAPFFSAGATDGLMSIAAPVVPITVAAIQHLWKSDNRTTTLRRQPDYISTTRSQRAIKA